MNSIAFIDTEIESNSGRILDIGSLMNDGRLFHKPSVVEFTQFIHGTQFICGHNIFKHDIKYIGKALHEAGINSANIIDTLFLSPLLFPTNPYHALLKDDKLQSEDANNPLNDAIKAKDLFYDEITAFKQMDEMLQCIFYSLLSNQREFYAFFRFMAYVGTNIETEKLIHQKFKNKICEQADLVKIIAENPIELAYCLSLIHSFIQHKRVHSITPPWVLKNYPEVERIMFRLRNKPCISGCAYCNEVLDAQKSLQRFFGFDAYRSYGGEPLQDRKSVV